MASVGIDPAGFLSLEDSFDIDVYQRIAARTVELADQRDDQLAIRIANRVGDRLGL